MAERYFIISGLLFVILFIAIFVYHFIKVNSFYNKVKDFCFANNFKFKKNPNKNVKFQITGFTKKYHWIFQNFIVKPNYISGDEIESYFQFSVPGVKINNMFIIGKAEMANSPGIEEMDEKVVSMFLKNVLGDKVAEKLKDIIVIEFGRTDAFKFQYLTLSHKKANPLLIIDEELENLMANGFDWVADNDFSLVILPDRLIIKTNATNEISDIKTVIELGTKIILRI